MGSPSRRFKKPAGFYFKSFFGKIESLNLYFCKINDKLRLYIYRGKSRYLVLSTRGSGYVGPIEHFLEVLMNCSFSPNI